MSPILQGLDEGYSPEDILKYIYKAMPKIIPSIDKARRAGYRVEEILGFLGKATNGQSSKGLTENEIHAKNSQTDASIAKHGLGLAAGAIAAPIAGKAVQNALSRALPQTLAPLAEKIGSEYDNSNQMPGQPQPSLPQQIEKPPIASQPMNELKPSSSQPPVSPNLAQPVNPVQPEVKSINSEEILSKSGLKNQVDSLIDSGNGPEEVSGYFDKFKAKEKKAIEKESGMSFDKVVEDYLAKRPKQEEITPEKQPKIEKSSIVASPQGIGEVKEIRNGKAIIEIDGKKHQVNEDELESPSFSEDEVADVYEDLMSKIPEEHRSGFISWAGYDEDRNVLGFIPRGGKYEELTDITPEEAQMIKEGKGVARTTGANREGLWVAGEDTRGGVISQIIHDRRNKHKALEEKQGKFDLNLPKKEKEDRGMKPIFDEMSYARNLSRERERKKKLEERERKKKEKDEAKKRKK